ncbi:MAG: sensor histidine kinase [Terriglobales bacterium]
MLVPMAPDRPMAASAARLQALSRGLGLFSALAGGLVLVAWWLDIALLRQPFPQLSGPMTANSALAFVCSGLALYLLQPEKRRDEKWTAGALCGAALAALAGAIGLLTLAEYAFHADMGIDQLLLRNLQAPRMAVHTALAWLLTGGSLLLLAARSERGARLGQLLSLLVALLAYGGLVANAYGAVFLFFMGGLTGMALHTSLLLMILSGGLLTARPERSFLRLLASQGLGGGMARVLIPAAIGVPFVLGWLRLWGERAGLYGTGFGVFIFTLLMTATLIWLIYRSATVLDRLEAQRREAEDELNRFFSISMDLLCIAGTDGYFKLVNPRWEKILGYSQQELLSQPYLEFIHPEDREATLQEAAKQAEGRDVISFENRYRCRDGSYRWFNWTATAPTERGLIYAAARDVTERKQTEQRIQELNRELGHKLDEVRSVNQELEGFSYSVAHDLRAPLRHVDGFSKILLEDHGAEMKEDARRLLERVRDGAQHMGALIDELLNFSRLGRREPQRQITGMNSLVEEARAGLRTEADGRSIEWRVGRLPYADCDPALMKQVFSNLIANALKFTRPREQAVIEVGQVANNGQTAIFVRDNGVGFDMKYADKLFGVFQRLHRPEDFEGTGVGLALVQKIVQKHGGRIWVEAALDRGATFYFTLGAGEAAPQPAGAETGGAYGK